MINVDTITHSAKGSFYADNGVTLAPEHSVYTNIAFTLDTARNYAVITFTQSKASYDDPSIVIDLIEIVNVSKLGPLRNLLKMKIDGHDEVQGNFF